MKNFFSLTFKDCVLILLDSFLVFLLLFLVCIFGVDMIATHYDFLLAHGFPGL